MLNKLIDICKRYIFCRNKYLKQTLEMSDEAIRVLKKSAKIEGLTLNQFVEKILKEKIHRDKLEEFWREN